MAGLPRINVVDFQSQSPIHVVAGVSPAVEPGVTPGGNRSGSTGGKMPPSTAGVTPTATYWYSCLRVKIPPNFIILIVLLFLSIPDRSCCQTAHVEVDFSTDLGALNIDHMALGQGGLSDAPMWADRVSEIRALHPRILRLFVQEYFNLLPQADQYHFSKLDSSVETILGTGARPLMCLCFKPN